MKKLAVIFIVFITILSLCACSPAATTPDGETVKVGHNEVVFQYSGTWTVVGDVDWASYYVSGSGRNSDVYRATLTCDNYVIVVDVTEKEYALWKDGTTLNGQYTEVFDVMTERNVGTLKTDTHTFEGGACFSKN